MPHSFTLTIDGNIVAGADEIDAATLADTFMHVANLVRRFGPQRAFQRMRASGQESLAPILFREIDDAPGATHIETIRTH